MDGYSLLVTACALFVGTHFIMSHPARARLVKAFGDKGFQGFYSLVSLITFGWMIWTYRQAPTSEMAWAPTDTIWAVSSLLTVLASVLFLGSFIGNPVLTPPSEEALAAQQPSGALRVTRHPMMWGFALWGIGHILVAPRTDSFIFVGSIIFLALVGAAGQDKKKAALGGDGWRHWVSATSYWPRLSQLGAIGIRIWLAAIAFWLVACWAHGWFSVPPAGIYRWL
jgi:uncharacterized membrane protein